MDPNILFTLFASIGGISVFLPLLFMTEKISALKLFSSLTFISIAISVFSSFFLSEISGCDFYGALFARAAECKHYIFFNTRLIGVFNIIAFSSLVMTLLSLVRIILAIILRGLKSKDL